ncbi:capsid protein [Oceanicola sp. 22II-s10i]|uniref:phage major capsid protein n=1 Tax=Oceanicola sp. 22II-s10i TaxID=1317116 RepID=UPI000B523527|nr:phage major capsid protein [Oceanicola sp. 22II-s10i]OWU85307.1 capsid protein [Oceanicola sp. 22II-s10i]
MTKTESISRTGEAVSPDTGSRAAVAEFMREFKGFRDDIDDRLKQQENRMTMLDRTARRAARPVLASAAEGEAPHQKAFAAYLRSGDDDALRGLELEGKAMSTAVAADGGYLVDPETSSTIKSVLSGASSIRQVANVVTVEATAYDVLVDHTDVGSGWAGESTVSDSATPSLDRISIPLYELSALPKVSQRLLDDSAFDIEAWLAGRIADKFLRAEAAAFVNGNGSDKPTGFLTHTKIDNDSWAWDKLGYVATGTDAGFDDTEPGDALVDLVYALGARYRANGTFVMNSKTAGAVRKVKDGDGRFMWTDTLAEGEPARLMGYPVLIAEDMPDIASDSYSIAFGDFGAGYTVAERPDLRVLRDPFSAKPHVLFYATKRVGGDVSDFAAIKLLKFGLA